MWQCSRAISPHCTHRCTAIAQPLRNYCTTMAQLVKKSLHNYCNTTAHNKYFTTGEQLLLHQLYSQCTIADKGMYWEITPWRTNSCKSGHHVEPLALGKPSRKKVMFLWTLSVPPLAPPPPRVYGRLGGSFF